MANAAFEAEFPDSAEREVLRCLFFHGPTFDGDIPSKAARSALFERHLVARANGWNALTGYGFERCVALGLGDEKEARDNRRRRVNEALPRLIFAVNDQTGDPVLSEGQIVKITKLDRIAVRAMYDAGREMSDYETGD